MAIGTPVDLGNHNQAASTTNILTTGADSPVGSLIIVFVSYVTVADTLSSVADSAGNTYVVLENFVGTGVGIGIAYCSNSTIDLPNGGTITATFGGSTASEISACNVSGANGGVDLQNQTDSGLAAKNINDVVSGTPAVANEIFFGVLGTATTPGSVTYNGANAFVVVGASSASTPTIAKGRLIISSIAAVTARFSWGNSVNYAFDLVSFKITPPATFVPFVSVYPPLLAQ